MDGNSPESDWTIDAADDGGRVDAVVARRLGLGRAAARRLLDGGAVRLGGRRLRLADKGRLVRRGDRLSVAVRPGPGEALPEPEPGRPLTVVAEGPDWLVVDKPAGWAVHPLRPGETGTVLGAVAGRYPAVRGVGEGGLRSGVVHRLDVGTSGAVAVALSEVRFESLRSAFRSRAVSKRYVALVRGRLTGGGRETMRLVVAQHRPARVRVVEADGSGGGSSGGVRVCRLGWRALACGDEATLVEVMLETGFLHQIRVMLAAMGHPVLDDPLYGDGAGEPPGRPMLHALSLSAGMVRGYAEPPADFAGACDRLGLPRAWPGRGASWD